ncbi:MAG: acyl-CoA dehydrogenase [Deltaproteobacteria bacterium]|nr:acyl-CoA dehydrogenase [Deltaproteobacteria bacterium]
MDLVATLEAKLDPVTEPEAATMAAWDAYLTATLPPERAAAIEREGIFPRAELDALLRGPAGDAFVPHAEGGTLSWSTLMRICSRLAERQLGVVLCLGGVVLGELPFLVAGNAEQRAAFMTSLREGGLAGLALSEWDHGSDLLGNDTVATETHDGWRLSGTKRPINNASVATHLAVLARTGEPNDPFGATLFHVRRPTPGLSATGPVDWSGFPGMDLDGVVLDDAAADPLGGVGKGFALARRVLEISRGGVACMANGVHAAAVGLAEAHVRERSLYGAPIAELEPVRVSRARLRTRLVAALALGRVAARTTQRAAVSARQWTCAAKLLCPELLERSVHDAGTLLGARSLMGPFAALRRDAPILAIFDGSSQLQKDELWRHAATWRRELEEPSSVGVFDPWREDPEVAALCPLSLGVEGAAEVHEAARGARSESVATRFAISEAAASLYALAAMTRLGAPAPFVAHARWLLRTPLATMGVAVKDRREPWEPTEASWGSIVG